MKHVICEASAILEIYIHRNFLLKYNDFFLIHLFTRKCETYV